VNLLVPVLVGLALVIGLAAAGRRLRRVTSERRIPRTPEAIGMQSALHAATATLPHLRRGLSMTTAARAVPHLRRLTGAAAIALADKRAVLAIEGEGRAQVRPGDLLSRLLDRTADDRLHIVPRLVSSDPTCPLHSAVLAPLTVQGRRAGTLITFYRAEGRPSGDELRVVSQAASLVSAQIELSVLPEQEERVAQAELRALRAQISPHFIYNALAAVAGNIHARPEEARELLIDFAEFTRFLFRDRRSYVALSEEIEHVERYLRLERARFRELQITIDIPPETRRAIVPAMSVQPLVENAVRHGIEQRAGNGRVTIEARQADGDVELRVADDGPGIESGRIGEVLTGTGGGIGLSNVDARLRATFGERCGLRIESVVGQGTTVIMTVPHLPAATDTDAPLLASAEEM
jgi:two-component system LytT family sensor kinase